MTGRSHADDLKRWLDRVTDGLPTQASVTIRAEMAAHMDDAAEDYAQQGLPEANAYQRALADLGDPQPVARRFSDVHRGRRHYRGAMFACLLLLLLQAGFMSR